MMTYRNPQTGQTQQVGENETVRRGILERLGWRVAGDKAPAAEKPAEEVKEEEPKKAAPVPKLKKKSELESSLLEAIEEHGE